MATTRDAGGMFDKFEPAAPAPAPVTEPLFTATAAPVSAARDYGVAVTPVRQASTGALFDTELVIGSNGAFELGLVVVDTDLGLPLVD